MKDDRKHEHELSLDELDGVIGGAALPLGLGGSTRTILPMPTFGPHRALPVALLGPPIPADAGAGDTHGPGPCGLGSTGDQIAQMVAETTVDQAVASFA